jgi:hypothetical protein
VKLKKEKKEKKEKEEWNKLDPVATANKVIHQRDGIFLPRLLSPIFIFSSVHNPPIVGFDSCFDTVLRSN